jgi:hypothetical protein
LSNTPNQLADDFPEMAERIHALKESDNHFARLFEEYHELNREIHRVETRVEPTSRGCRGGPEAPARAAEGRDRPDAGGSGVEINRIAGRR